MKMKCKHCGRKITDVSAITEDGEPLCAGCFSSYYTYCRNCGRAIPIGNTMCKECSCIVFRKVINNYSTKISCLFGNKDNNTDCLNNRYFGLEMEYNNFNPAMAKIMFKEQYDNKLIYNKSDASIDNGVEIVTIPLVKSRALKLIDDMDISRLDTVSKGKRSVVENAGLHIHVSRNTITPIGVNRLSLLFNSYLSYSYKDFIYYLVGRANEITDINCDDHYFRIGNVSEKQSLIRDYVSNHNSALNLSNDNTIEFRLFKATTNPTQLKSYIEFVELAIEFAETQPIRMISMPNFLVHLYLNVTNDWLRKRLENLKSKFPNLFTIKEHKYTLDYYLDKFDMSDDEKYHNIQLLIREVSGKYLNWDKEKITKNDIKSWTAKSYGHRSYLNERLLELMGDKLKEKLVTKILTKKGAK